MDQDYSKQGDKGGLFPELLHDLLDDVEKSDETDIVAWAPSGRCFKVFKKQTFVKHILPRYFKQSKYKSFVRQLNIWGFSCIDRVPEKGHYHHQNFIRGKKELCSGMVREKIKGNGPLRGQKLVKNSTSLPVGLNRAIFAEMPHYMPLSGNPQFQSPATTSSFSSSASSTLVGAGLRGFNVTGETLGSGLGFASSLCGDQSACAPNAQSTLYFSPAELLSEHPQVRADTRIVSGSMTSTMGHQLGPQFDAAKLLVPYFYHGGHNHEVYDIQNGQAGGLHDSSWTNHQGLSAFQNDEQNHRCTILRNHQEQLLMLHKERNNFAISIGAADENITTDDSDHGLEGDWLSSLEKNFDDHLPTSTNDIYPSSANSSSTGACSCDGSTASNHPHHHHVGNNNHDQDIAMTVEDFFEPTPLDSRPRGSIVTQL